MEAQGSRLDLRYSQALWKHKEALGVSATHLDWTMVPYVRKSFHKHWMTAWNYFPFSKNIKTPQATFIDIVNTPIDSEKYTKSEYNNFSQDNLDAIYKYAMDMTKKELKQAVEGMYHNLNN